MNQMSRANSKQTTTAIRLLETVLRTVEGRYLGHRDGAGDVQNDEAEENELAEDDGEGSRDGKENLEIEIMEGVASSLGDLSTKGSLPGVLKSLHAVRSRKPISTQMLIADSSSKGRGDQRIYKSRFHVARCKHLALHSQLQVLW